LENQNAKNGQPELLEGANAPYEPPDPAAHALHSPSSQTASKHPHTLQVEPSGKVGVLAGLAMAIGFTGLALVLTLLFQPYLTRVIFMMFWPAVLATAVFAGLGPALLASLLSILAVDFWLMTPRFTLGTASAVDLAPLGIFFLASAVVSTLADRRRAAEAEAREAARENGYLAAQLETQTVELESQLEEAQVMSEELEQTTVELHERNREADEAAAFSRGILESISDPFVVQDADWRFRFINSAAARVFAGSVHVEPEALIDKVVWDVYPTLVGSEIEREMRRAASERIAVHAETFYADQGTWAELFCYPLANGGLATQWKDITARKKAEEALDYLDRATELLVAPLDPVTRLNDLARLVVPKLADWCAIQVRDENGMSRQVAVAHVDPDKVKWARELNRRYPPRADAPTGAPNVLRTGQAEIYPEITDEMLVAGAIDAEHLRISRELGLRSAMVVPLTDRGETFGVLTLVSAESRRRYTPDDLSLAGELARRAALAIDQARLYMTASVAREEADEARARAEQAAQQSALMQQLTAALSAALTTADVANAMLDHGLAPVGAIAGVVCRLNDDATAIDEVWGRGYPVDGLEPFRKIALTAALPPRDVVQTRAAVFVENPEQWFERYLPPSSGMQAPPAAAAMPLMVGDHLVGVMVLRFPEPQAFREEQRSQILSVASQCAQALERARALEAEREARIHADEANRAKSDFLATMSHELRTPLNAIAGYAELLDMELHGPITPSQHDAIARIQRSQRHLLGLINDVLNFARIEAGRLTVDFADVPVHETLAALETLIAPQLQRKSLSYSYESCDPQITVRADAEKFRQILLNVLSNAVKFTEGGGQITVTCTTDEEVARIAVTDTGLGIPADKQERIFAPFVQLDSSPTRAHEGTGLGLAISRDLARAMGGDLTVTSTVGVGSTFTLTIPRH
jgi:signal transduction histidine kinase/PAS domain-containing protein